MGYVNGRSINHDGGRAIQKLYDRYKKNCSKSIETTRPKRTFINKSAGKKASFTERDFLYEYSKAVAKPSIRPVKLCVLRDYDSRDLDNVMELKKAEYLSNDENIPKLVKIADRDVRRYYNNNIDFYGISSRYNIYDVPDNEYSRNPENFVFTYSDRKRAAMINAPKVPIGDWKAGLTSRGVPVYTIKVLYRLPDEVMIGEVAIEKTIDEKQCGIRLYGFYKGEEKGIFTLHGSDYQPIQEHKNIHLKNGQIVTNGFIPANTTYSHTHNSILKQRLFTTQNGSHDVIPTIINNDNPKVERHYKNFDKMANCYLNFFNVMPVHYSLEELERTSLRKFANKHCPLFIDGRREYYDYREYVEDALSKPFREYDKQRIISNEDVIKDYFQREKREKFSSEEDLLL